MKEKICPYPGLRPFTQEESIFFKGRDLHVRQVINQLEERKFVMVTGASGDGKSSLVYAGVIPNALAGFFHAEYNNWLFVDFRPERDPIGNLTASLTEKMQLPLEDVSERMQYGFASLVNIYKTSPFFIDKNGKAWNEADDHEKRKMRSKAANLLILADQFEEFFTNQENYINGKPSVNAYTTVNLLLETARLAIKDKLPIYIVFTMRSDFISQCVAFKNLPEFIGFSQFFVPRLKRNELQQVIEEPAKLSGGTISKRLVEVLINELRDGFDQLPVLQHCLNALWRLADNGERELDLIHLAQAAGMPAKFLTEEDSLIFKAWFATHEQYVKDFFANPSLANVLNAHANQLYVGAYEHFLENTDWAEKSITLDEALFIIKVAFQCLTKIDEGRSVRNRMTLIDIARIINKKHITPEIICGVMNIFRLPSNTFIRPFVDPDDVGTQYLSTETVLDITHEALIRNWELLKAWEDEEAQNLSNFRDFETQLHRWVEKEKSVYFLLSPGNLAHFEEWYAKSNLSQYWIYKYDNSEMPHQEKTDKAIELAALTHEFLVESRKNIDSIERARRLRRRIATVGAIIVIGALTSFSYWALREKANAVSQQRIAIEQTKNAEIEKRKAELAQKEAEQSAVLANSARQQSETARKVAENMRLLADDKTQLALSESEKAQKEKQRADEQLVVAKEQRAIADVQRKKAELATDSAHRLSYLAVAQSLTFKADKNYNDPQLNLLLAYYAYKLNQNNGGPANDPDIFQALTAAQGYDGLSPIIIEPNQLISSIRLQNDNAIECFSKDGSYMVFDIKTQKLISEKQLSSLVPVNESFIIPNQVLVSYENTKAALWDYTSGNLLDIIGQTDFIRSAIYLPKHKMLVAGSRDKSVRFYNLSGTSSQLSQTIELDARISNLSVSADERLVYAACSNGKVYECDLMSFSKKEITNLLGTISAMLVSANDAKLVIATAKGRLRLINLTDYSYSDLDVSSSMIDAIAIDSKSNLLAVSSADKLIRIYQLGNPYSKPYFLYKHNQKSKVLSFSSSGKLYALGFDNKLRCWDTNIGAISQYVKSRIKRELSAAEWEKYIGKGVNYQKVNE